MPSISVVISLAESSEELLSVIVVSGSGGGFASSYGTGFIAASQFGYVIFDIFFFEKPVTFAPPSPPQKKNSNH